MIFFVLLCSLRIIIFIEANEICMDYDGQSSLCHACSLSYFQNASFSFDDSSDFSVSNCVAKSGFSFFQSIFVTSEPSSDFSNGTMFFPYSDLFTALKNVNSLFFSYKFSNITIYLMGSNPHYLSNGTDNYDHFSFFRRVMSNITILPLFCEISNVSGCFTSTSEKAQIVLKKGNIYFFISYQMSLINIIINGIDINLDPFLTYDDRNMLSNVTVCSSNESSFNNYSVYCFPINQTIVINQNSLYGLFNIESYLECTNCDPPKIFIINCEFINFHSLMKINGYLSIIQILKGISAMITISNSIFDKIFFVEGIVGIRQSNDPYYKYISNFISVQNNTLQFSFTNNKITFYNFYNLMINDQISVFDLDNSFNKNTFSMTPTLNLSFEFDSFQNQNLSLFGSNFSLIFINGVSNSSSISLRNIDSQNNNMFYLLKVQSKCKIIEIQESYLLNNVNQGIFISNFNTFLFNNSKVANLTLNDNAFFSLSNTILMVSYSTFNNFSSNNFSYFISILTIQTISTMSLFLDSDISINASFDSLIIVNSDILNFFMVSLMSSPNTISSVIFTDNNFYSVEMSPYFPSFINISIENELKVSRSKFENFYGDYIFDLPYSRNRTFEDSILINSRIALFATQISSLPHYEFLIFSNLTVQNVSLDYSWPLFYIVSLSLGSTADLVIKNSIFSQISSFGQPDFLVFIRDMLYSLIENFTIKGITNFKTIYFGGDLECCLAIANFTNLLIENTDLNILIQIDNIASVFLENSSFSCYECNQISKDQDAISATCFPNCYLVISNCSFSYLSGDGGRGALSLTYQDSTRILIVDCKFYNNGMVSSSFADIRFTMKSSLSLDQILNNPFLVFENYNIYCLDLQSTDIASKEDCIAFMNQSEESILFLYEEIHFFSLTKFNMLLLTYGIKNSIFSQSMSASIISNENSFCALMNTHFFDSHTVFQSPMGNNYGLWYTFNVTITNCSSTGSGGAITTNQGAKTIFIQSYFDSISAGEDGGAFYVNEGEIKLISCQISNTKTSNMGGLLFAQSSLINFTNVTIVNTWSDLRGGSFFILAGSLFLEFCVIQNSFSVKDGGVIYSNLANLIMGNTKVLSCETNERGVIFIQSFSDITTNFSDVECSNNQAYLGACVYMREGKGLFSFSNFSTNTANDYVIYGDSSFSLVNFDFKNCSFIDNFILHDLAFQQAQIYLSGIVFFQTLTSHACIDTKFSLLYMTQIEFIYFSTTKNSTQNNFYILSLFATNGNISECLFNIECTNQIGCISFEQSIFEVDTSLFNHCSGVNGGAIQMLSFSDVIVHNSQFKNNSASYGGGLNVQNSYLVIKNVIFTNNSAILQGSDLYVSNELITSYDIIQIVDSFFSDFSQLSTFIDRVKEINFLNNSYFQKLENVGNSQALNLRNVGNTTILLSNFFNIKGLSAVECFSSTIFISSILIKTSVFSNSSSKTMGGALKLSGLFNITILDSDFNSNYAEDSGGAISFGWQNSNNINFEIKNNLFRHNSAFLYGGVIKLLSYKPSFLTDNIFENNTAQVGDILITNAMKIFIALSLENILNPLNFSNSLNSINITSGQTISLYLLICDEINNFLMFEDSGEVSFSSNIELSAKSDETNLKIINGISPIKGGVGFFSNLMIIGEPGMLYGVILNYKSMYNYNFSLGFPMSVNFCRKGEVYVNRKCIICSKNLYSLDENAYQNSKSTCDTCPENAKCFGSYYIVPNYGYWKKNNLSILMIKCFHEESCPDQIAFFQKNPSNYSYQCTKNASGSLCSLCDEGLTKNNNGLCVDCSQDSLMYVRFFGMFAFSMIFLTYQARVALKVSESSSRQRSLLKILINHNYYLNFLDTFKEMLIGDFQSFYQFSNQYATSAPDLNFDCFLTNLVSKDSLKIARVTLYSFFPLFVICIIFTIRIALLMLGQRFEKYRSHKTIAENIRLYFGSCFLVAIYNFYSRLISNSFQLLQCMNLDQTSTTYLEIDPNIRCWETNGLHVHLLKVLFLPNLIIWCVGWPLTLYVFLKFSYKVGIKFLKSKAGKTKRHSNFSRKYLPQTTEQKSSNNANSTNRPLNLNSLNKGESIKFTYSHNQFPEAPQIKSQNFFARVMSRVTIVKNSSEILLSSRQKEGVFEESKLLRFLTVDYLPDYYYWEGFFYATNLLIAAMNVATSRFDIISKGAIYICIYFSMLVINQHTQPFRFKIVNQLASYSYIISLMTVGFVLMSSSNSTLYFAWIIIINISFYVLWVHCFLKLILKENWPIFEEIWEKLRAKKEKTKSQERKK